MCFSFSGINLTLIELNAVYHVTIDIVEWFQLKPLRSVRVEMKFLIKLMTVSLRLYCMVDTYYFTYLVISQFPV